MNMPSFVSCIKWLENRAASHDRADYRTDAHMSLAYLYAEQRDRAGDVDESFDKARELYTEAINTVDPKENKATGEYEPAPETKLGILLSSPLYRRHDLSEAFKLFGAAMQNEEHRCQHAVYWMGRALLYGFGTPRDPMTGFGMVQEAAGHGVLRAKFELAALFERGWEGESGSCVRKNPVMAEEYYRSISITAPVQDGDQEWVRDYALSHLFRIDEQLDKDDEMGLEVGSVLSWELAGQAFLFGAIGSVDKSDYRLVQTIGMAIGCLSLASSGSAFLKNIFRRQELWSLFVAKVNACGRLVPQSRRPWWHCLAVHTRYAQAYLALLSDVSAVALSIFFVVAWSLLDQPKNAAPTQSPFRF